MWILSGDMSVVPISSGSSFKKNPPADACQMDTDFPVADERRRKKKQARARPPI
jgi:hypothetical protein